MRMTFLLAFQQFCFRAWAKQGSAEAWEPRGDANTRERGLNPSSPPRAPLCLTRRGNPPARLIPPPRPDAFRWRWFSQLSLKAKSCWLSDTKAAPAIATWIAAVRDEDIWSRILMPKACGLQSTWTQAPDLQRTSILLLSAMRWSKKAWLLNALGLSAPQEQGVFQVTEVKPQNSSGEADPNLQNQNPFPDANQTRCAHSRHGM